MQDLKDKVAVVTGGASGIGKSIGLTLAEKGTHVVVADIEQDRAEEAAAYRELSVIWLAEYYSDYFRTI